MVMVGLLRWDGARPPPTSRDAENAPSVPSGRRVRQGCRRPTPQLSCRNRRHERERRTHDQRSDTRDPPPRRIYGDDHLARHSASRTDRVRALGELRDDRGAERREVLRAAVVKVVSALAIEEQLAITAGPPTE
jgi:hypothetical protein